MKELKFKDYKKLIKETKKALQKETNKTKRIVELINCDNHPRLWKNEDLINEWKESEFEVKYFKKRTIRKKTTEMLEILKNQFKTLGEEKEIKYLQDAKIVQELTKKALNEFPENEEKGHEGLELARELGKVMFEKYELMRFIEGVNRLFTYGIEEGSFAEKQLKETGFEEEIVIYSMCKYYIDTLSSDLKEKIKEKALS